MTPIGHALSGYLVARPVAQLSTVAVVLGAIAPDIDFVLLFHDDFNALHRTFTHSLLFVAVFAGMWLGQRLRRKLNADTFRTIVLVVLFVAGVNMLRRALMG